MEEVGKELAGYVANGNDSLKNYGASIAYEGNTLKTVSSKYTTAYPLDSNTDNASIANNAENISTARANNYKKNALIYGDAIRETSTAGTGNTTWYGDASSYPGLYLPLSIRGGYLWGGSEAGLFYFSCHYGDSGFSYGFRAVLTVS